MHAPLTFITMLAGFLALSLPVPARVPSPTVKSDYVVLLHGLGRTARSMSRLKACLASHGYRVVSVTYPSTRFPIEYLSDVWLHHLLDEEILDPTARVHFVTHSLGGIILRQYLSNHSINNLGRVVMLAPPNHGSEIIDRLKTTPVIGNLLGPGRLELGTDANSVPHRLGPANFGCGVIAGDRSLNPFLSAMLPGPSDGKVTVASARLDGMRDFVVLHTSHTWLMWRKQAIHQILIFLKCGHFEHRNKANSKVILDHV